MYRYSFNEWLALFYFYCIFGWCFESLYVSIKQKHFVNRGFMKGPWLPLYGSGAIIVLFTSLPFRKIPLLVFIVGALSATILEYVTGEIMVKLFKVRYWDYSNNKFNLKGHVCLVTSIAWGFLSLFMVYVVHDPVAGFVLGLNREFVSVVTFLITVCMVYDFTDAFKHAMSLRGIIIQKEELKRAMEERIEQSKEELQKRMDQKREEIEESILERQEQRKQKLDYYKSRLKLDSDEFAEKKEILYQKMEKHARQLLLHNPGSKFVGLRDDGEIVRMRIKDKIKERKEKKNKH